MAPLMDTWTGVAWMTAGLTAGTVAGIWLAARRQMPIQLGTSRQQVELQQEALDRMRESNLSLAARLQEMTQQNDRQLEALRRSHAVERASSEEEIRRLKDQLRRIIEATEDGQVISSRAFAPTQFDEPSQGS